MNVIKQCKHGLMCYNTNDLWVSRSLNEYGEFSEGEVDLFKEVIQENDFVMDVGANIGAHTVVFSKLVKKGTVFAFEPQRAMYYLLCANVALNNLTNVYCLQNALSNKIGRINIPELDYKQTGNFGGLELEKTYTNKKGEYSVKLTTIDDFNLPKLNFLKIDVEGMEAKVIEGAKNTINKFRPILYVENDRKDKSAFLISLIRNLNYDIYFHLPPLFNPSNYIGNDRNVFGDTVSINIFCYPSELIAPDIKGLHKLDKDKKLIVVKPPTQSKDIVHNLQVNTMNDLLTLADVYSELVYDPNQAMKYIKMALEIDKNWYVYHRAAPILSRHLRYNEALKYINLALENGGDDNVLSNKAITLSNLEDYPNAINCYKQLLTKYPNNIEWQFGMAIGLLFLGNYKEGFKEYECRFKRNLPALVNFLSVLPDKPYWQGEPNKNLLLFCEQGAGDLLQFIRYIPKIKAKSVKLLCQPDMYELLKDYVDVVVMEGLFDFPKVDYDCHASLLSLPYLFGTTLETIPPPAKLKVKGKVNPSGKIGICWAGSETHPNDFTRSCPLKYFKLIDSYPLVSLQKGPMKRNWPNCGDIDLTDDNVKCLNVELNDYNDTAKVIEQLELVITVDTSIAHLAATLGKETWLLIGKNPDWRWLKDRRDSPWYSSIKIFKGEWEDIFYDVKGELDEKFGYDTNFRAI